MKAKRIEEPRQDFRTAAPGSKEEAELQIVFDTMREGATLLKPEIVGTLAKLGQLLDDSPAGMDLLNKLEYVLEAQKAAEKAVREKTIPIKTVKYHLEELFQVATDLIISPFQRLGQILENTESDPTIEASEYGEVISLMSDGANFRMRQALNRHVAVIQGRVPMGYQDAESLTPLQLLKLAKDMMAGNSQSTGLGKLIDEAMRIEVEAAKEAASE